MFIKHSIDNQFNFFYHFQKYSENIFLDKLTYADLKKDVLLLKNSLSKNHFHDLYIALQIKSPYLLMVALMATITEKKIAVLISDKENPKGIEIQKTVVPFEKCLTDEDIETIIYSHEVLHTPIFEINNDWNLPSIVVFSSGSTAAPKGVALSFNNIYFSALGFNEYFAQTDLESTYLNLPHHHVGGLLSLWRSFFSGGSLTSDLSSKIDFISLVPTQLKRMLQNCEQLKILQKIRVILVGGAPLTHELKQQSISLGLKLFETYGMSESTSLVMINGEVLPFREVKLDELGFFNIKGKTLALGYFQNKKFSPFANDWFKTKDIGELDVQGKFIFKERSDLIFISGGENINPLMVEEVIKRHPAINEAYLVPISDEEWGAIGIVLYDSKEPISSDDMKFFLKDQLHPHLIPKFFFKTELYIAGQLKIKRSLLKTIAYEKYLKFIFSFDYFELKNAPLLVMLHGFLGEKNDLLEIAKPLMKTHSLLLIDLPGHGETDIAHFYSFNDAFKKLSDLILLFGNNPSIYGYSMGARVGLHLALYFLKTENLILESGGLGLIYEEEKVLRLNNDLNLFKDVSQTSTTLFLDSWYKASMFKTYSEHRSFKNDCEKKSHHDYNQWKSSMKLFSVGLFPLLCETLKMFSESSIKCTYIYGDEDQKYKDYALLLKKTRPQVVLLENVLETGHNPHKTHQKEVTDILIKTLK